jgi:hypothetical protein
MVSRRRRPVVCTKGVTHLARLERLLAGSKMFRIRRTDVDAVDVLLSQSEISSQHERLDRGSVGGRTHRVGDELVVAPVRLGLCVALEDVLNETLSLGQRSSSNSNDLVLDARLASPEGSGGASQDTRATSSRGGHARNRVQQEIRREGRRDSSGSNDTVIRRRTGEGISLGGT